MATFTAEKLADLVLLLTDQAVEREERLRNQAQTIQNMRAALQEASQRAERAERERQELADTISRLQGQVDAWNRNYAAYPMPTPEERMREAAEAAHAAMREAERTWQATQRSREADYDPGD